MHLGPTCHIKPVLEALNLRKPKTPQTSTSTRVTVPLFRTESSVSWLMSTFGVVLRVGNSRCKFTCVQHTLDHHWESTSDRILIFFSSFNWVNDQFEKQPPFLNNLQAEDAITVYPAARFRYSNSFQARNVERCRVASSVTNDSSMVVHPSLSMFYLLPLLSPFVHRL